MIATLAPTAPPVVRHLAAGEARDLRRHLRTTLLFGRPLAVADHDLYDDESLHLDWYLTRGEVRVVEHRGRIRGHLLAGVDRPAFERWHRARTRRWARSALARAATGELTGDARRYAHLRVTDELAGSRGRHQPPFRAHAHVALDPDLYDPGIAGRLHDAIEGLVLDAGLDGWITTIDVPRRVAAPVARDVTVVGRSPNRTATWLLGRPVDRVTLAVPVRPRHR